MPRMRCAPGVRLRIGFSRGLSEDRCTGDDVAEQCPLFVVEKRPVGYDMRVAHTIDESFFRQEVILEQDRRAARQEVELTLLPLSLRNQGEGD